MILWQKFGYGAPEAWWFCPRNFATMHRIQSGYAAEILARNLGFRDLWCKIYDEITILGCCGRDSGAQHMFHRGCGKIYTTEPRIQGGCGRISTTTPLNQGGLWQKLCHGAVDSGVLWYRISTVEPLNRMDDVTEILL